VADNTRFRWVYLQLEQLFKCKTDTAVERRLAKRLPENLDKAYEEIYENNTKDLEDVDKAYADRAFIWVLCSAEPFSSTELLGAVRLTTRGTMEDRVSEETLLDLCQDLLTIESRSGTWRFPHASVVEYFEGHHWTLVKANAHVAKVCLSQMLTLYTRFDPKAPDFRDLPKDEPDMPESPIQSYVRYHWTVHVMAYEDDAPDMLDTELIRLLKDFLKSPMESSIQYRRWFYHIENYRQYFHTSAVDHDTLRDFRPPEVALFLMAGLPFTTLLMDWWEGNEIDCSVKNTAGMTLLSITRSVKVCELLLENGVDVNEPVEIWGNALAAAVYAENMAIVKLLVYKGRAEVNVAFEHGKEGSVLSFAVLSGDLEMVKFLVEDGKADANVPLQCGTHGSALATAALIERLDIVKYLIEEAKVDVNMPLNYGDYGSALAAAAGAGNVKIVKYLVNDAGAKVNVPLKCEGYGSVLAAVAARCEDEIVKFLVQEAGADVNMPLHHGLYGSALAAATSAYRDTNVVKLLVQEAGADVNMPLHHGLYGSALAAACNMYGGTNVVKFLVEECNADIGFPPDSDRYKSPLTVARETAETEIFSDGAEIVDYLLEQIEKREIK
jgi:ankyrin repeat protein